jgi:hypothetical protein
LVGIDIDHASRQFAVVLEVFRQKDRCHTAGANLALVAVASRERLHDTGRYCGHGAAGSLTSLASSASISATCARTSGSESVRMAR